MKDMFARHGIPRYVMSDNGPQFRSAEYATFAEAYGFELMYSSRQHPKSNGQAERCVQTVKRMIKKCDADGSDIQLALLNYRNTLLEAVGASPTQLLTSRRLRSRLPITRAG